MQHLAQELAQVVAGLQRQTQEQEQLRGFQDLEVPPFGTPEVSLFRAQDVLKRETTVVIAYYRRTRFYWVFVVWTFI